jgi:membrane-bound serine protease (ClpP class)
MKILFIVLIQALAFGAAIGEALLPTFGLLGLLSLTLSAYSWFYILTELPRSAAIAFGIADLLLIPVAIKLAFAGLARSPMAHRSDLGTGSGLEDLDRALKRHVGEWAVAETDLRPTGKIRLGDEFHEAQALGEWIARGRRVRVLSVNGSRFQVEAHEG